MFSEIPNNLSSLYSELLYSYTATSTADMTFQIYESETDELLGVKKFYSTSTAQLNIAPHIRAYAMPSVADSPMGFITPYRNANLSVYLKMVEQNSTSTSRQFTLSRSAIDVVGLITSLPKSRTISDGEAEQLYIAVDEGDQVGVTVTRYLTGWSDKYERPYVDGEFVDSQNLTTSYTTTASDGGIEIFNFVAESSKLYDGEQIEKIVVTVSQNSSQIAQVCYHVVELGDEAVRMAWLSDSGSVEHYTFPLVKQMLMDEEQGRVVTLSSAFECYAMRKALAEIVRSARVWIYEEGDYRRVSVADESVSVVAVDPLAIIDIKILCDD